MRIGARAEIRRSSATVRWLAVLAVTGGVVALIALLATMGGPSGHVLSVTVPDATNVLPGQFIRDAGVKVGTVEGVTAVDGGHKARLKLRLDNSVWPLPQGTRMALHWGGTVSYVNRYILLDRGPSTNPPMATDGVFPATDFSVPVEFDTLLSTFTPPVRRDLKSFMDNAGTALATASPALRRAIEAAPPALTQASDVLGDLDANEAALSALVRSGASVVDAVNRANPGVGALLQSAATTFSAIASRTRQLDATLAAAPSTLVQARDTLASAEPTLNMVQTVSGRIARGVEEARRIAGPLDSLLVTLTNVGPDAIAALGAARRATPSLNPLLAKAAAVLPQLGSISRQAVTSLECVRPYTPDIVAIASDWADFLSGVDGKDHYFRAQVQTLIPAPINAMPYNSAQLKQLEPWISYVFPPPPGFAAGQPWFLPQCGEGPETLNAGADPENNYSAPELPPAGAAPISLHSK